MYRKIRIFGVVAMLGAVLFSIGARAFPNSDSDSIGDALDNCTFIENPLQRDTDGDTFGNRCDADFDNSGIVNFLDFDYLSSVINTTDDLADLNGDGIVNFLDLSIFAELFFMPPGPSGFCVNNPVCDGPNPAVFRMSVTNERSTILLTDPELIAHARSLIAGGTTVMSNIAGQLECTSVPYNSSWNFHLVEGTIYFFTDEIEICDASTSYIERNCDGWVALGLDWCPWQSVLDFEIGN